MCRLNITPPKIESKLLELVRQTIAASEYFDSVEFRKKTCSKRARTTSDNFMDVDDGSSFAKRRNSIDSLLNSMDWDKWVEETKWKRYDSDSSSKEESDLRASALAGLEAPVELECELKVPDGEGDLLQVVTGALGGLEAPVELERELKALDGKENLLQGVSVGEERSISEAPVELKCELKLSAEAENLPPQIKVPVGLECELKAPNGGVGSFGQVQKSQEAKIETPGGEESASQGEISNGGNEEEIDQEEFERILGEKRANKLYSIFRRKHLNLGTPVTSKCNTSLGGKRKISPTASTPEPARLRISLDGKKQEGSRRKILFSDDGKGNNPRARLNTVAGGSNKRNTSTPRRRTRSIVGEDTLLKNQKKITDMLKEKAALMNASNVEK